MKVQRFVEAERIVRSARGALKVLGASEETLDSLEDAEAILAEFRHYAYCLEEDRLALVSGAITPGQRSEREASHALRLRDLVTY